MNTSTAQLQAEIDKLKAQAQVAVADAKLSLLRRIDDLQRQLDEARQKID